MVNKKNNKNGIKITYKKTKKIHNKLNGFNSTTIGIGAALGGAAGAASGTAIPVVGTIMGGVGGYVAGGAATLAGGLAAAGINEASNFIHNHELYKKYEKKSKEKGTLQYKKNFPYNSPLPSKTNVKQKFVSVYKKLDQPLSRK